MKLQQANPRLNIPAASIESLQEHRYWLQCERAYTFQPIYKTDGCLMAIELLTVVTHPSEPEKRIAPDRYFSEVAVRQRVDVVHEQIALLAMRQNAGLMALVDSLPWIRFELVEHIRLPQDSTFASISEIGPLWLDDFGTGMANFSALSEVRYDYIKVARDLFIMLRKTPEGQNLFILLLQLMNHYCQGVIVEGVETLDEWRDVQNSPAFAAQGYFLSRPVPLSNLEQVTLRL